MAVCRHCGWENPDDAAFCINCGRGIERPRDGLETSQRFRALGIRSRENTPTSSAAEPARTLVDFSLPAQARAEMLGFGVEARGAEVAAEPPTDEAEPAEVELAPDEATASPECAPALPDVADGSGLPTPLEASSAREEGEGWLSPQATEATPVPSFQGEWKMLSWSLPNTSGQLQILWVPT